MKKIIIYVDANRNITVLSSTEGGDFDASQEVMDFGNDFCNWPFSGCTTDDELPQDFSLETLPVGLWLMEYDMNGEGEAEDAMLDCKIRKPNTREIEDFMYGECIKET